MTAFEALVAQRDAADAEYSRLGLTLNAYPKSAAGLTPDHIKASQEWKDTYQACGAAHNLLRRINQHLVKHYAKELKAEREAKRAYRRAA